MSVLLRLSKDIGAGALSFTWATLLPLLLLLPLHARAESLLDGVHLMAMIPSVADGSDGYVPLAPALRSAYRLAAERINEEGALGQMGNVSVGFVESLPASAAAASLCRAIGENETSTVAVLNALNTASASLIGSLSSEFLHLPILNIGGMAARTDSLDASSDSFLLGVLPDIIPQMRALVRLILDMKLARDAVDGRSELMEQVWLVHTSDSYGTTAAAAFGLAASNLSVALPVVESDGDGSGEPLRATVDIVRTTVLAASTTASFDTEMATLASDQASIVVFLADGFDPGIVRNVLTQARSSELTEAVQWYVPDAAAMDHIFDVNSTHRDAELAYDMRGMLGVRSCVPLTGPGASDAEALTSEWQRLDPTDYLGAGPNSLTEDGRMDPLLAFAYDSVFLAAFAARDAQDEVVVQSGMNLSSISLDRCPFPVNGTWDNGTVVRDSMFSVAKTLTGVTGPLRMSVGDNADGRDVDTVTFCAVNLRPHTTQGGRFEVIRTLNGAELEEYNGEGFQAVSPFQEEQTFPAGSTTYPFDRPLLKGRHLDVVMRRNAPPFVFVAGEGEAVDDFTGITPVFLKTLSELLGFTYSLRAPPEGTSTGETIAMVRNGSADMTGSWITITAERSEYVAFTYPYFDLSIAFVYKPSIDESVNLWKAFEPFEPTLWLTLLFALIGTVFLLWLFEGAKNDQFAQGNWGKRRRTVSRGLSRSVYVTASLMMAQLTHKPETLEGYLLTLGWLFTSFVLAASYTAELASFLTATKLETTGLTVEGLKNGEIPHTSVALLQGGNTQMLYERDFMGCTVGEECGGIQPLPCYSTNECFDMVANGTAMTTLFDSATADYQLQTDFCGLATLPETLYPQHYGLVLPLDSPVVEEFQVATLTLREDGTLQAQAELFLDSSSSCVSTMDDDSSTSNMTVGDVSGVFVVLIVFVSLSICSWCTRRSPVAKSVKARRRRARGQTAEETMVETFSKMSRRQQKSFALEATVKMLQESKASHNSSSRSLGTAAGMTPEERRFHANRQGQREDIAEGRPVVSLGGGGGGGDSSMRWFRMGSSRKRPWFGSSTRSSATLAPRRQASGGSRNGRRVSAPENRNGEALAVDIGPMMSISSVGGADGWSSNGSSRPWVTAGSSPPQRGRRKPRRTMFGMFGQRGTPPAEDSPEPSDATQSAAVQTAASKWLARRATAVVSPIGERVAVAAEPVTPVTSVNGGLRGGASTGGSIAGDKDTTKVEVEVEVEVEAKGAAALVTAANGGEVVTTAEDGGRIEGTAPPTDNSACAPVYFPPISRSPTAALGFGDDGGVVVTADDTAVASDPAVASEVKPRFHSGKGDPAE